MASFVSDFHIIRPDQDFDQKSLNEWVTQAWAQRSGSRDFRRFLVGEEKLNRRGSFHPDFGNENFGELVLFGGDMHPGLDKRNAFFQEAATKLFSRFYAEEPNIPDEIIHVSCTGYCSPSAAQLLVGEKGWNSQTAVTHLYHMGCYAALPALKMARAFASENRVSDIVHTELCSLHFDVKSHSPEQAVVQSLFADGAARYKVRPERAGRCLEILSIKEAIIPKSNEMMTWKLGANNLAMSLDKAVPVKIRKHFGGFVEAQFREAGFEFQEEKSACHFAIHPGGPQIIDQLSQLLELRSDQIRHSSKILRAFGNMSSATLPHIWQSILSDESIEPGQLLYSVAFGPGLTMAGMLGKIA